MLVSDAWFDAITATLCAILVLATSYPPPWWFWGGSSHESKTAAKNRIKNSFQTVQDVPGPFALPVLGTRWIFSWFGPYQMNKIHDAYKGLQTFPVKCKISCDVRLTHVQNPMKSCLIWLETSCTPDNNCPENLQLTLSHSYVTWYIFHILLRIDLNLRYGPLCKEEALWNWPVISVFSRDDIEAVIGHDSKFPLRPPQEIISQYRQTRQDRYTNLGLVNEQGANWKKLRAALTPKLMGAKTVLGFFPALNQVSDDFIDLIRVRRSGDDVTGFEEIAYRMGLESTCTLILGRHLGFLKPHSATSLTTRLAEAVRIHFTASRDAFYGLPLWKILPTAAYKQLIESEDAIYNIITQLVEATELEQKLDAKDEDVEAVFQSILRGTKLDMRDKKAAIIDFIAAGIHTLGNTLVFLFYLIGRDSKVQKRLYEETATLAPPGCDIKADDLKNAKYLDACINEAFRVIPTVPCIARILDRSTELSGYKLEAGTVVLLHTWIAGLDDKNFKNASEFIPERWLEPTLPHSPLLVAPFGSGRRMCPGKRFVEQALQLIVAKVVREFEIVAEEELNLQFEYIIAPKGPVVFTFRDRTESA